VPTTLVAFNGSGTLAVPEEPPTSEPVRP
jgi:hypothetical protein